MTITIIAVVLGLLISAAAIFIPRLVARRNDPECDADSRAYMKETGRSSTLPCPPGTRPNSTRSIRPTALT